MIPTFLPEASPCPQPSVWRKHGQVTFNVIEYADGARLSWLSVPRKHARKGLAHSFMHLLAQWADENEIPLTLEVFTTTMPCEKLAAFYAKYGFKRVNNHDWEMRREFSRLHM